MLRAVPDKPLIALTCDIRKGSVTRRTGGVLELNANFAESVARAGGNPIAVTPHTDLEALSPLIDGWLIPGGRDIDAARFGESNHPKAVLQGPFRYGTEARLYELADPLMPILGICYGCQFLNVRAGGTLVQHLPDDPARERHTGGVGQEYEVEPGSRLAQSTGATNVKGKSYHHQGIGRVAPGLRVTARHADGTIEALEAEGLRWMIGVQWHPERSPNDPANLALFRSFIDAACEFRANRGR